MDEPDHLADARRLADQCQYRLARRYVNGRDAHLVAGTGHNLGRRVRIRLAAVGEHDVLADADAACDGLTDLAGSDDNDDVLHGDPLFLVYRPESQSNASDVDRSRFASIWAFKSAIFCSAPAMASAPAMNRRGGGF